MALDRVRSGEDEEEEMWAEMLIADREWLKALWYVRRVARGKRERTRANEDMAVVFEMGNETREARNEKW